MAFEVQQTTIFRSWLANLRDVRAQRSIARHIERMVDGNFGDHKAVGGGVSEMRIDTGPGYRLYYVERKRVRIILLCGGDKSSQARDIRQAKTLVREL